MRFFQRHQVKSIDFTEYEHGTYFMKFVVKDDSANDSIESNGKMRPSIELHGLISESGEILITDEIIIPRKSSEEGK